MSENTGLITNALLQTAPQLYAQIDGGNSWAAKVEQRGARTALYRRYERGDHRANITAQVRKMLRLTEDETGLNDFNDNYMRIVIDKMAGRIHAQAITTDENSEEWLVETLKKNSFISQQGSWWRGAVRDGNSFVMIDPETRLWTSEPAFDGYSGMVVIHNQMTRRIIWACKLWSEVDSLDATDGTTGVIMRLVVYQPDKISYWVGEDGGDAVAPDTTTPQNWELWPGEMQGALPIVDFGNAKDAYTMYGESEIRPAVPLQDVLNRLLTSTTMGIELNGTPINVSIGMMVDANGFVPGAIINMVLHDSTTGNVITDPTPEQLDLIRSARVEQLRGADMQQFIVVWDKVVKEISQATQTPIYGITSDGILSGEALKQLEIGLIGKVERFQRDNTDAIRQLIETTAAMERVFAPGLNTPDVSEISVQWKPAELLDTDAKIAALSEVRKNNPGLFTDDFYRERIGAMLGLSIDEIQEQNELAANLGAMNFERLVGAGGGIPVA